jgi:O-antigen/teichoic acid export membrane protein
MLASPLAQLSLIVTAVLQAGEEFGAMNRMRYLPPLANLVALTGLAVTHHLTPFSATLAILLPGIPILLWMLVPLWRLYRPRWVNLGTAYKQLFHYGLRSYGNDLLGTLSGQLDQVLVVGALSAVHMGLYGVAVSLARMLQIVQSAVLWVLFPTAAGRPTEEVVAMTGRAMRVTTSFTLLGAVALFCAAPLALRWCYGPAFLAATVVVRILVLQAVLDGATTILAQAFMALGRPETVTTVQAAGLSIMVILLLLLIPRYGLIGAGMSLLLSALCRLTLMLLSYPLILKTRPPSLLVSRADFQAL